jgi:hypothetical protein
LLFRSDSKKRIIAATSGGLKADGGRECQTARYRRDGSDTLIGVKIVGSNR